MASGHLLTLLLRSLLCTGISNTVTSEALRGPKTGGEWGSEGAGEENRDF